MKRSLFHCALLAFAAGGAALPASGAPPVDEEAKRWLERMLQATQNLNYEGTFIYVQGPHIEAMRIAHGGGEGGERQRLVSLTGPTREILVSNDGVISLLPKRQTTFSGSDYQHARFPISIPRELGRLENQYDLVIEGQDRTAGVETQVVAIKPRDSLRYGYRLWLDQRNGMLLRSALLDENGYPIEQLMFTDLQFKQQTDEAIFKPPVAADNAKQPLVTSVVDSAPEPSSGVPVTQSAWTVARLPDGFSKILHNRFTESSGRHPTEHMVFADGLATVSVFVERLDGAAPLLEGNSRLGSMNAFGSRLDDYQVVVVGEVPATTVQTIAASISYAPKPAGQPAGAEGKP